MKNQLTVVLTTHILPTAPSTSIIEECIESIRENFIKINECQFKIYCDVKNSEQWFTKEYLNNLKKIKDVQIIENPNSGLKINYLRALSEANTPYILFCEHDWIFLDKINTSNIVKCLNNNSSINFIRFNKRDNQWAHIDHPDPNIRSGDIWETYIEDAPEILEQSLMKTNCIATHPHIIRKDIINTWLPFLNTWSIEWDLFSNYNHDINKMGFKDAHEKWGIYNYGNRQTKQIIKHIDGNNSGRI